jgi:hypothetical protein
MSSSFWLQCLVPKVSTGKLHWAIHAWRLLDRMGFGLADPCFSLTVWFHRERFEALLAFNIMEHAFLFHGPGREYHGSRNLSISNGGSSLCDDEKLSW